MFEIEGLPLEPGFNSLYFLTARISCATAMHGHQQCQQKLPHCPFFPVPPCFEAKYKLRLILPWPPQERPFQPHGRIQPIMVQHTQFLFTLDRTAADLPGPNPTLVPASPATWPTAQG